MPKDVPRYILDPTYCFGLDSDEISQFFNNIEDQQEEAQVISNYDSGDTVAEAIENIRHLPYEVVVTFDRSYRKILDFTCYSENACCLHYPNSWRKHLQIMIHNHPYSNWDFSDQDIITAAAVGVPTQIVVCKNYTFVLENLPREWRTEAPSQIRRPKDLKKFILSHHTTDCLIEGLIDTLQQAGLQTTYSIYNLRGERIYHLPIGDTTKISSHETIRILRNQRHLNYVRQYS